MAVEKFAVEASRLSRPAGPPIVFSVTPPAALTDMELHYTTTMPGFILDDGRTTALEYAYQSSSLARDFPNLDLGDSEGYAGADTITISTDVDQNLVTQTSGGGVVGTAEVAKADPDGYKLLLVSSGELTAAPAGKS